MYTKPHGPIEFIGDVFWLLGQMLVRTPEYFGAAVEAIQQVL